MRYQGSIDAKLTVATICVFVLCSAGVTGYILFGMKHQMAGDYARDADHLILMIQREAALASSLEALESLVRRELAPKFGFSRIEISAAGEPRGIIGGPADGQVVLTGIPPVSVGGRNDSLRELRLKLFHPPFHQTLIANRTRIAVTFGLPLFGVAIALFMITRRLVTRPLLGIVAAVRSIANGDLNQRIDIQRNDELGVLADFFNLMVDELRGRELALRSEIDRRVEAQHALSRHTEELGRTNEELKAFSYTVSHDLRAPLRAINGFGLLLEEDCASQLDGTGKSHLRRIRCATQRMEALIEDVLKLSRVARHELTIDNIDLGELALQRARQWQVCGEGAPVELVVATPLNATGDKALLGIALDNLLSNAWKFSAKADAPSVEVGQYEDREQGRVFYVRDNGVGFDMQYENKLFEPFQRLHADSEFEGSGIGLATVQRIVERHGGRIWAESEPGQGACFYFTLAAQSSQAALANVYSIAGR